MVLSLVSYNHIENQQKSTWFLFGIVEWGLNYRSREITVKACEMIHLEGQWCRFPVDKTNIIDLRVFIAISVCTHQEEKRFHTWAENSLAAEFLTGLPSAQGHFLGDFFPLEKVETTPSGSREGMEVNIQEIYLVNVRDWTVSPHAKCICWSLKPKHLRPYLEIGSSQV